VTTSQDQNIVVPPSQPPTTPVFNVCMMCVTNSTNLIPHENPHITMQTDFVDVKALASRLIAAIHADEIEKKLLRFVFFNFENIQLTFSFCFLVGKKVDRKYLIIFVYIRKYVIF